MASRELFHAANHSLFDHYNKAINIVNIKPCKTFFLTWKYWARPRVVDKVSRSKRQETHTWSLVTILSWHPVLIITDDNDILHFGGWSRVQWGGKIMGLDPPSLPLLLPLLIPWFQAADSMGLEIRAINSDPVIYKLCDLGQVTLPLWASISSSEMDISLCPCF